MNSFQAEMVHVTGIHVFYHTDVFEACIKLEFWSSLHLCAQNIPLETYQLEAISGISAVLSSLSCRRVERVYIYPGIWERF